MRTRETPTAVERAALLDAYPELRYVARETAKDVARDRLMPPAAAALCWWLFDGIDPRDRAAFWMELTTGDAGPQVRTLRASLRRLQNQQSGYARDAAWISVALTIEAWNAFRADRPMRDLNPHDLPADVMPRPR